MHAELCSCASGVASQETPHECPAVLCIINRPSGCLRCTANKHAESSPGVMLTAGNKAELQDRLTQARQDQGEFKAWLVHSEEEEAWNNINSSETLPAGAEHQRLYRLFRLEQRRQELDQAQQNLYSTVKQLQATSPAETAEQQAIQAAVSAGLEFSAPVLQELIAQSQAGGPVNVQALAQEAAGKAQASGGAGMSQAAAESQAADPQDLSSYKYDASSLITMPAQERFLIRVAGKPVAVKPQMAIVLGQCIAQSSAWHVVRLLGCMLLKGTRMCCCRASELKEELARLSLPTYGSRQQLEERLMNHYQTIMQQDDQYEALAQEVHPVTALLYCYCPHCPMPHCPSLLRFLETVACLPLCAENLSSKKCIRRGACRAQAVLTYVLPS